MTASSRKQQVTSFLHHNAASIPSTLHTQVYERRNDATTLAGNNTNTNANTPSSSCSSSSPDVVSPRWLIHERLYSQQYAAVYYMRLHKLRTSAIQQAKDSLHLRTQNSSSNIDIDSADITICKKILDLEGL
jgi:hypothetical protein